MFSLLIIFFLSQQNKKITMSINMFWILLFMFKNILLLDSHKQWPNSEAQQDPPRPAWWHLRPRERPGADWGERGVREHARRRLDHDRLHASVAT